MCENLVIQSDFHCGLQRTVLIYSVSLSDVQCHVNINLIHLFVSVNQYLIPWIYSASNWIT